MSHSKQGNQQEHVDVARIEMNEHVISGNLSLREEDTAKNNFLVQKFTYFFRTPPPPPPPAAYACITVNFGVAIAYKLCDCPTVSEAWANFYDHTKNGLFCEFDELTKRGNSASAYHGMSGVDKLTVKH
jgi:hypothetical protein